MSENADPHLNRKWRKDLLSVAIITPGQHDPPYIAYPDHSWYRSVLILTALWILGLRIRFVRVVVFVAGLVPMHSSSALSKHSFAGGGIKPLEIKAIAFLIRCVSGTLQVSKRYVMMNVRVFGFLCGFALFVMSQGLAAKTFVEGVDYEVVKSDGKYQDDVVEFFSYACPFCYRAESVLDNLDSESGSKVSVVKIPVHFGKSKYKVPSHAWFLSKELGLGKDVHKNIFDVIHVPIGSEWDYNHLRYMEDLKNYFMGIGISEKEYDKALKKVQDLGLVEKANDTAKAYSVGGTPAFLVKGKYMVHGFKEGPKGEAALKELLRYLVEL